MFPRVRSVRHLGGYRLELEFADGRRGELDFQKRIVGRGGVFLALEDPDTFRQVRVNEEFGTLVWPNGVDFCPDALYSEATGTPLPAASCAGPLVPVAP